MLGRRSILALVATAIFVTATLLTFTSNVSASSTIESLTIITPTEGEYLGGTYTITWTVTGSLDGDEMYNVHYYDPEKCTWVVIQNCIAHDGGIDDTQSVNWNTSGLTETSGYKVRVQCWESGTKTQEDVVGGLTIDNTAPSGYTVSIDQPYINSENQNAMSFTFAGAEIGATYSYSVDDTNDATPAVTGTGTITAADQQITGIDVSSLDDGTLTLSVTLTDEAGNTGDPATDTVDKDTVAPTVTVNSLTTNDQTPQLTGTVNDNTATIQVTVNGSSYSATNNGDGTWTLADDTITPALLEGTYDVSVAATDTAGNVGTDTTSNELVIDVTPPVSSVDPISPYWNTTGSITITVTATDTASGVSNVTLWYRYRADNESEWSEWTYFDKDTSEPWSFDFDFPSGEGCYELYSIANDSAGNAESAPTKADEICGYDATPPEITLTIPTEGSYHANIDSITGTATDVTSGVDSVYVAIYSYSHGKWWNAIAEDWSNDEPSLMQATIENNLWRLNQGLPDWENAQKYMVTATAVDSAGNSASVYANFTILGLHLYKGWNLVSVPRELENPSIEAVFEGVTSVARVYYYDPTSEEWRWAIYDDGEWDTSGGLTTIDDGKGYWIYATAETNVTLTLKEIEPPYVPPTYQIKAGWNMIGYTSINLQPTMNVTTYLSSLNSWIVIYKYDTSSGTFYMAKPGYYQFNDVALTEGYWLYTEIDDELVP